MCGRYWLVTPLDVLASRFHVRGERIPLVPRWNAAPGQDLPVVRLDERATGARVLEPMRWGLVPSWAAGPGDAGRPINARAETAAEKPSFREPLRRNRALVPADGFYEWKAGDRGREPYGIRLKSRRPFAFAAIWDSWKPPGGPPVKSFAILTTPPNAVVEGIHDRMPLILTPEGEDLWMDPGVRDPARLAPLFVPRSAEEMEAFRVSPRVNTPANDDPSVLEPPGPAPPRPETPRRPSGQLRLWENDDDDGETGG